MNHKEPIHVTQVSSSSESFKHELKTIKEGKEYEIEITPGNISTPGLAVLRIETDCEITRHRIQQAFAVVRRPLPGDTAAKP
jgi:hypothetical protein